MKKWIGAAVALLFFVGLLAFLLLILGWQKQLDQESAEYEVLSSAVQLPQASEPPVVTPSEADSSVLNDLISSLDGDVLSEDIPASSAPARTSSIDLEACKAQNSDFAAWLSIPNTPVNYPVVFTYDTAYYLKHSFTGSTSSLGTLFATGNTSFNRPSRNIAIYGHNTWFIAESSCVSSLGKITLPYLALLWAFFSSTSFYNQPFLTFLFIRCLGLDFS